MSTKGTEVSSASAALNSVCCCAESVRNPDPQLKFAKPVYLSFVRCGCLVICKRCFRTAPSAALSADTSLDADGSKSSSCWKPAGVEGAKVGSPVGAAEGAVDGVGLGAVVGCRDGAIVSAAVGADDGNAVGVFEEGAAVG